MVSWGCTVSAITLAVVFAATKTADGARVLVGSAPGDANKEVSSCEWVVGESLTLDVVLSYRILGKGEIPDLPES